ncbi:MAG: amino acid ABC transporter permease [Desulfobacterales bacterium]|nr:amino acid ABC transporter permease [Deltaproteobacteria bacterium]NNL42662.1 amino acid ABC transporter permease [Desulfobacterales bacterium]
MPKNQRNRITNLDIVVFLALTSSVVWLAYRVNVEVDYKWNWSVIPQYLIRFDPEKSRWVWGLIMQGVFTTLRLSIWATILAMIFGTVMGLLRVSQGLFNRLISWSYVELIRNIPILVWIFIFYYFISDQIMPFLGLDELIRSKSENIQNLFTFLLASPARFSSFLSGLLALAIYEGAYITEIIRAGIQSIEKGQWEASSALGFSRWQQMRYVIFPQAIQRVMPPLAGQFISTIKDSAIVSVISIQELTFQGMELMSATFLTFEVWIIIMVLYLLLCLTCSLLVERLEIYMKRGQVSEI